jgi:hypothetical protein
MPMWPWRRHERVNDNLSNLNDWTFVCNGSQEARLPVVRITTKAILKRNVSAKEATLRATITFVV